MTQHDRVRLLFGPYQAPPLNRGDRATCLLRDCTVVITSWTDARIPWPRCRAVDSPGGGSGLLLDEELARAVRHESAAAVMHWWGVSEGVVWRWRKALGVARADPEGSRRLYQAVWEAAGAATQAREWTEEERERRRRTSIELGLGNYLEPGYHEHPWPAADVALLGMLPDSEAARRTGRTPDAVRQNREGLRIPNPTSRLWTAEQVALLGTLPDEEVARMLGRAPQAVMQKRCKLGIPTFRDRRRGVDGA